MNKHMKAFQETIGFVDWLAAKVGSHRWVVARATPKLKEKYDVFISPKRYVQLRAEYDAQL